jgi:hypothetical protein
MPQWPDAGSKATAAWKRQNEHNPPDRHRDPTARLFTKPLPGSAAAVDLTADLAWYIVVTNVRGRAAAATGLERKGWCRTCHCRNGT